MPDIEKLVDIPPTRSNALKPPSESEDSDDTLPAVGFNHATQPSSANTSLWLLKIIVKGEKENSDKVICLFSMLRTGSSIYLCTDE